MRVRRYLYTMLLAAAALLVLVPGSALAQIVEQPFADLGYTIVDLGSPPEVPNNLGGLTIRGDEPNRLYIGSRSGLSNAEVHVIEVERDEMTGRITGFSGTAEPFAPAPEIDGGLLFAPNGTMMYTRFGPNSIDQVLRNGETTTTELEPLGVVESVGGLARIPAGFPGAGGYVVSAWSGSILYLLPHTINPETGAAVFTESTHEVSVLGAATGPEGFAYLPLNSPGFETPSVSVNSYNTGNIVTFEVDANGLPDVATARTLATGISSAQGATIDPVTGDLLISTFAGGNRVLVISGFGLPADCEGTSGGARIFDGCGECRLMDDPEWNATCGDCNREPFGPDLLDDCGECLPPGSEEWNLSCTDCAGVVNGSSELDDCGECLLPTSEEWNASCADCAGVPNGDSELDDCGECALPDSAEWNASCTDCAGVLDGDSELDDCGECLLPTSEDWNTSCTDCAGVVNGDSELDDCGECLLPTSEEWNTSCADCDGVVNGSSEVDDCGECLLPTSEEWNTSCADCDGVPNGSGVAGATCVDDNGEEGTWTDACVCFVDSDASGTTTDEPGTTTDEPDTTVAPPTTGGDGTQAGDSTGAPDTSDTDTADDSDATTSRGGGCAAGRGSSDPRSLLLLLGLALLVRRRRAIG